jgi:amicyanin
MTWQDSAARFARGRSLRGILAAGLVAAIGGAAVAAEDAQIMIDNFKFSPIPMAVAAGSTITWVNRDGTPHSIVVPALEIRSSLMSANQSYTARFDQPGTYDYICGVHPFMHGKLVVQQ